MMEIEEREYASQSDQEMMGVPGGNDPLTDSSNPLTYDPTQERGTDAWQAARQRQAELNAKLGLETNARFRRN